MKNRRENSADTLLLIAVLLLTIMGILTVFSSSSFYGKERYNDSLIFFRFHMVKVGIGLVLLFAAMHLNYHTYRWITPIAAMTLLVLLVATLFGPEVKGSHRALIIMGKQVKWLTLWDLAFFYKSIKAVRGCVAHNSYGTLGKRRFP